MKNLLMVVLGMSLLTMVAVRLRAADSAANADPLASIVPQENPYHPGDTIETHKNLSDKEWPQLGNTPQRTNYSPMKFDPPQGKEKWAVCLTDLDIGNRINATVQPIIADGRVYVGCKNGKFFALDAKTGKVQWTFQAGGPICHTAGYAKGKVVVAALDGCVYAVAVATGEQDWVFADSDLNRRRHGYSTAVLLAEDKVFAVDRGGRLFALNLADGKEIWHYDAGAPVDQSPAYDAGKVFFASEDMRVHAVRAADGAGIWRSEQLGGLSFRWFYPVVVGGKVIVRSLCSYGGITDNTIPAQRNLFALDEDTGKESVVLKQMSMGHDGTQPPPAVTSNGLLIVQMLPNDDKENLRKVFWALEDVKSQEIVMPLLETDKRLPNKNVRSFTQPWYAGLWTGNENSIVSVIGDMVITAHPLGIYYGGFQPLGGAFDLAKMRWHIDVNSHLPAGDGKGQGGWVQYGGDGNESGGSDAMSAADGFIYHCVKRNHTIICYEPEVAQSGEKEVKP